jgi:flagellar hook protein FlgE
MSLFGSLFTGVSALTAQSQALSMISNNIANISTVGYKGDNASFSSLVTVAQRGVTYNPGGVRVKALQTVNQQGLVQGSSSTTDIAISGDGFFVVKDTNDINAQRDPLYTRAGNFSEDSVGFLRNAAGFFLYGWRLDADGNIPAANADISSTEPVNVAFLNGVATGTTRIELGLNLNSEQALGASSVTFVDPTSAAELTTTLGGTPPFSHDFDVTVNPGNGGPPVTTNISVTDLNSLNDVAAAIDAIAGVAASVINNQLVINAENVADTVVLENGTVGSVVTNLFGSSTITQLGYDFRRTVRIFDSLGAPRDLIVNFKKQAVNQWLVEVRAADNGFVLPVNRTTGISVPPDPGPGDDGFIASGVVNFNTDGSIQSVSGQLATPFIVPWDPAISGAGNQTISFDMGIDPAGNATNGAVTQFASPYNVAFVNQNGAELGQRTGISIDEDGFIVASFSNGEFRRLYKLPIATFANPNGLQTRSGNVFAQTTDSGQYNLREAGSGGAGRVQGGSLEQSNVDLSNEFTKMIVTQRAYSAGTKVISTADGMLEELMRLR